MLPDNESPLLNIGVNALCQNVWVLRIFADAGFAEDIFLSEDSHGERATKE